MKNLAIFALSIPVVCAFCCVAIPAQIKGRPAGISGQNAPPKPAQKGWQEFTSPDSSFSVLMPGKPKPQTDTAETAGGLVTGVVFVFSGIIVPLPFLPSWLQRASSLMPFRGLIDTPLRIYLGQLHGSEAFTALALQGVWLIVLIVIGRVVMSRGLRRLVAQGG